MGANRAFAARTFHSSKEPYSWQIVTAGPVYNFSPETRSTWRSQLGVVLEVENWIIDDIDFISPVERSTFELDFGLRSN